jgi:hypothetical protein
MKYKNGEDKDMAFNDTLAGKEAEQAEKAWAQLASRLETEEASPLWSQWAERQNGLPAEASPQQESPGSHQPVAAAAINEQSNVVPLGRVHVKQADVRGKGGKRSGAGGWLGKHAGKVAAACAAAVLTIVIATPSANEALAAWLNKFQMNDEVIVVQEDDLQAVWNSLSGGQGNRESVNRFGTFEHNQVGEYVELTLEQAEAQLGFKLPAIQSAEASTLRLSEQPGSVLSLRLNVTEINDAIRKLGGDKLLPKSVDGQDITVEMGKGIAVNYTLTDREPTQELLIRYMAAPSISVDPALEVKEAYQAVIHFPLLPDYLRQSLQQSVDLDNGNIPLPLVVGNKQSQLEIGDTTIYIEQYPNNEYISAIWMQDDKIVQAGLRGFSELTDATALLTELVQA